MGKSKYFVDCGDDIEYVDSLQEAQELAEGVIDDYREACDPDWPEEVEGVCYGQVLGAVRSIKVGDHGQYVDFKLEEFPDERDVMIRALRHAIDEIDHILRVPAAEYVPAIQDVFTVIDQLRKTCA